MTAYSNTGIGTEFRCIGCGVTHASAAEDFRCPACGDLLEICYPDWRSAPPEPVTLKAIWRDRKSSPRPADQSGVWRFHELLPPLRHPTTLREGNTPVYQLPSCARAAGMNK